MTNLERRVRKLDVGRAADEEIVIEIAYVHEPPKSALDERDERPGPRPSGYGPRVTTVYLREDDLNL
jgi:hypothetical protein